MYKDIIKISVLIIILILLLFLLSIFISIQEDDTNTNEIKKCNNFKPNNFKPNNFKPNNFKPNKIESPKKNVRKKNLVMLKYNNKFLSGGLGTEGKNILMNNKNTNCIWEMIKISNNKFIFKLHSGCYIESNHLEFDENISVCSIGKFLCGPQYGKDSNIITMGNVIKKWIVKKINNKFTIQLESCFRGDQCSYGNYLGEYDDIVILQNNAVLWDIIKIK